MDWLGNLTDSYFRTMLLAVSIYTVTVTVIISIFGWLPSAVRIPLVLPVLLFAPGYAVVTAVFPNSRGRLSNSYEAEFSDAEGSRIELSFLERCTVAVFTSVVIVALVALVVDVVVGIRVAVILSGVSVVTLIASAIGMRREPDGARVVGSRLAPDQVNPGDRIRRLTNGMTPIAIVLIVILLSLSGMYLVTGGNNDSPATEFYMIDEDGDDVVNGSNQTYRLRVAQHSDTPQNYTIVVMRRDNESSLAQGRNVTHQLSVTVPPGSTIETAYQANISEPTGDSTVWFLLYRGDVPRSPTPESAYRMLRVNLNDTTDEALGAGTSGTPRSSGELSVQFTRFWWSAVSGANHDYVTVASSRR